MNKEIRYCPDGHIKYEVNPYIFNEGILNSDKYYCPVCGKRLEIKKYGRSSYSWTMN